MTRNFIQRLAAVERRHPLAVLYRPKAERDAAVAAFLADPDHVRDVVAGLTAAGGSGAFLLHQAATAAATRADT